MKADAGVYRATPAAGARRKLLAGETLAALGFMTGTSRDGVDAAFLTTDGEAIVGFGEAASAPFTQETRRALDAAVADALQWGFAGPEPESFAVAARALGEACARLGRDLIRHAGVRPDVIGFHGQTVLHRPRRSGMNAATRQIADAPSLSAALGAPVVYDFRSADVAAGGEGAPLAPVYHHARLGAEAAGAGVLNLGGVANLTLFGIDGADMLAFDCGPANGPVDEWVAGHDRGTFDRDGAFARSGTAHEGLLADWLDHPFFDQPPPKSLDRYDFSANLARGLTFENGCATLTEFAARAVARGLAFAPAPVSRLVLCGGGRKNPALVAAIGRACGVETVDADALGWRGDYVEAEAFAFMAVRRLRGLPISFPGTTGAPAPLTGGQVVEATA